MHIQLPCVFSEGRGERKIGLTSKTNKATWVRCSAPGCAPSDGLDTVQLHCVCVCDLMPCRAHGCNVCVTRFCWGGYTCLWYVPSLSSSATRKDGQQGKDRAIVRNQPLRQRLTHSHQGQMFWLATAFASRGPEVRICCGGQDKAGADAGWGFYFFILSSPLT